MRPVILSQIVKGASFQRLREITAGVFNQVLRTTNQRLGYKNLLARPRTGFSFPQFNPRLLQSTLAWRDQHLDYMMTRLQRFKSRGKAPPKKGLERLPQSIEFLGKSILNISFFLF